MEIVLEALSLVPTVFDYIPFKNKTLETVDNLFGICSEKSIAVRRAWQAICVPVDLANFDGCDIQLSGLTSGTQAICEEDNEFEICAVGNDVNFIPYESFHWGIIGRNAIGYSASSGSQVGTAIDGGSCLTITNIPEFPYYPQTVTIRLNIDGYPSMTRRFIINDCDGDDPTCEDYHDDNFGNNGNQQGRVSNPSTEDDTIVKVYDIMGRLIFEGVKSEIIIDIDRLEKGSLYIYCYFDNLNRIIRTEKIFYVD